ncbi:MAG TPA: GNAT family N-acetyltransferase [Solirubrobacterales bacterium]|nr:GNAT family N-acetyltransferase [Solirubrobacterales bacterium]
MQPVEIRAGTESDIGGVLALWRGAEGPPSPTDTAAGLGRLLRHDPGSLLLAESDDAVVGSLIAAWDGWRGSLYRLAVDQDWRRQGIATTLVQTGEERLRRLGAIRLTALVASADREAIGLWRAVGYERQPGTSRFVRMLG